MDREIKFRAWDSSSNNMIDNPRWKACYENANITLMQYTGLKDKNGQDIYEDDIMKTPLGNICHIKWGHVSLIVENDRFEYTGFVAEHLGEKYHLDRSITDGEIIGNIHENPDLL